MDARDVVGRVCDVAGSVQIDLEALYRGGVVGRVVSWFDPKTLRRDAEEQIDAMLASLMNSLLAKAGLGLVDALRCRVTLLVLVTPKGKASKTVEAADADRIDAAAVLDLMRSAAGIACSY